jgi:hypothetical protein
MGELDLRALLLWCRENHFRVREIQHGDLRLVLDDLGEAPPQAKPSTKSVHGAFAEKLGIPYPEDEDDEETQA